ncbi:MAG: nuclear transport factor 2 family protein [Candidatus Micrarchaeia archaeon]
MENGTNPKEVVLAYIKALDNHDYDAARKLMDENASITGNSAETYNKPEKLLGLFKSLGPKYEVRKVFEDGEDVCVFYGMETATPPAKIVMSSWYKVKDGKITYVWSVFDPTPFGPPPK